MTTDTLVFLLKCVAKMTVLLPGMELEEANDTQGMMIVVVTIMTLMKMTIKT